MFMKVVPTTSPPKIPAASPKTVRIGMAASMASSFGVTRKASGAMPRVFSAKISSLTFMALTLPVSRRDAVKGRILFCTVLEVIDLVLIALFILIKQLIGGPRNPAGLDAGVALIGEGMIIFAIFNMIFFPKYYSDISKPGKAFVFAAAAVFLWIVLEVVGTYTVPFLMGLDQPDPANMGDKLLFTLAGLALFLGGTAKSVQMSAKKFEALDLSL